MEAVCNCLAPTGTGISAVAEVRVTSA